MPVHRTYMQAYSTLCVVQSLCWLRASTRTLHTHALATGYAIHTHNQRRTTGVSVDVNEYAYSFCIFMLYFFLMLLLLLLFLPLHLSALLTHCTSTYSYSVHRTLRMRFHNNIVWCEARIQELKFHFGKQLILNLRSVRSIHTTFITGIAQFSSFTHIHTKIKYKKNLLINYSKSADGECE